MLEELLGAFLDSLTEREFDAPFLALLRSLGFVDLHFLHGTFEFGKDFIAKRVEDGTTIQYSFQTKGGDLGLGAWRDARGQIDEMRTNNLAHPNFDTAIDRRTVFVTTGRLVGAAPLAAQEYRRHVSDLGEGGFEIWDRESIIEFLTTDPGMGLAGDVGDDLFQLLAQIGSGNASIHMLERHSRSWAAEAGPEGRAAAEAAVIASYCRRTNRCDLASFASLMLVRSSCWHLLTDPDNENQAILCDVAGRLFDQYARDLVIACAERTHDPRLFVADGREVSAWITYPARVLRTAEILSLYALHQEALGQTEVAESVSGHVADLVRAQPGACHPISDSWAASLIPVGIVLAKADPDGFERWITEVIRWTANHYDHEPGLAPLESSPEVEIAYLFGGILEHVAVEPRRTSQIVTAVLDLCSIAERSDLYELGINEFRAVDVYPDVVEVGDSPDQVLRGGASVTRQVAMAYDHSWDASEGWMTAEHHRRSPNPYGLAIGGRSWEQLCVTAAIRDRWFTPTLRAILAG